MEWYPVGDKRHQRECRIIKSTGEGIFPFARVELTYFMVHLLDETFDGIMIILAPDIFDFGSGYIQDLIHRIGFRFPKLFPYLSRRTSFAFKDSNSAAYTRHEAPAVLTLISLPFSMAAPASNRILVLIPSARLSMSVESIGLLLSTGMKSSPSPSTDREQDGL